MYTVKLENEYLRGAIWVLGEDGITAEGKLPLVENDLQVLEINEEVAVLSENGDFTCEVNIITYGTGRPKLDIRKWNRAEDKMQKGITLNKEEALTLLEALKDLDFDKIG